MNKRWHTLAPCPFLPQSQRCHLRSGLMPPEACRADCSCVSPSASATPVVTGFVPLSLQSKPILANTRSWGLPCGQAHPRHVLEEHLDFWRSTGATSASRGAEMARPEDTAVPRGTCLALHSPSPSLHPVKPPGLPRACQQFPGGFLTSFCRVCSHLFISAQTCFPSAWQEGFVGCSCFYFPPLLPLRRR